MAGRARRDRAALEQQAAVETYGPESVTPRRRLRDPDRPPEPLLAEQRVWPVDSPFPPIAEYAFLSDCEVNALVSPSGRVEWMCLPRPDGPSVFAAILDRAAGNFRFGPTGVTVPAGRRYLPGTPVLETTWRARS